MKKKITLTLLGLVCALSCTFGLVACGDDGDTPNGGSDTIAVENVTLNKTTLTLDIDGTETLTATVTPDNATDKTVTWSSSAPTIASVDNAGKVTAKAEGTTTITATTTNDKTATCAVTVNAPAPTTEVTAEQWQSALSQAQNFTIEFVDSDGSTPIQYDGISLSIPTGGTKNSIYTQSIDKYYLYNFSDGTWVRFAITSDEYTNAITSTLTAYAPFITMFTDDFNSFTYADGKYMCATISKIMFGESTATVIKNIEIKFENGSLVSIKYEAGSGDLDVEVKDISSTSIGIPTNYTESSD